MSYFFTSDTHFSDKNALTMGIIKRDNRPFKTVRQMNRKIIKKWNTQAKKEDVIYHLGDFINYNNNDKTSWHYSIKLVKRIKAKIILILGNQEKRLMEDCFENNFEKFRTYLKGCGFHDVIKDGLYITLQDKTIYLNHFPVNAKHDAFNLFGHIHSLDFIKKTGMNVGVDNFYFNLFSEADIVRYMNEKEKYYDENVYCD